MMMDFNKKSIKDLEKMLKETRGNLREFRFNSAGSKIRNVKEGVNLRKIIARILTELSKRVKSTNL